MKTLLFALSCIAGAQTFPAASSCASPAAPYTSAALPAGFQVFRYGAIACDIPLANGSYSIVLNTIENRAASGADGAVGVGLRSFNFIMNGVMVGPLDPFAAVGSQVPYSVSLTVPITDGHLRVQSVPIAGNPILVSIVARAVIGPLQVSEIPQVTGFLVQLADGSTRLVPLGPSMAITPAGGRAALTLQAPLLADWQACHEGTCEGFQYFAVKKTDGTVSNWLGIPYPVAAQAPALPRWMEVQ